MTKHFPRTALLTTVLTLASLAGAQGTTLTLALPVDIPGFDTQNASTTASETVYTNMFDRLMFFDAAGKLRPALATSYKQINDTTMQLNLRRNVKFHNGDAFTAADVKFTLERGARDAKLFVNDTLKDIKTVKVINDHTVQIVTAGPDPVLLNRLSRRGTEILPSKYLNKVGWTEFNKKPIGTGPFKFNSWKRDDRVVLDINASYWRGKPAWTQLVVRAIPEEATRVNELLTGGVDIAVDIPSQDVKRIRANSKVEVVTQPTSRVMMFAFNMEKDSATSNEKLRAAIDYAIDRKLLIDTVMGGYGTPVAARVTQGVRDAPLSYYKKSVYDPKKAAQMLKEAGYRPGQLTITLQGPKGRYPQDAEILQTVGAMLQAVGINTKIETLEWSAYNSRIWDAGKVTNMGMIGVANSMMDGWFALRTLPCKGTYSNITHWCNPTFDKALDQASSSLDRVQRAALLRQAYAIVASERPMISLFQVHSLIGINKRVDWQPRADEVLWMYEAKPVK
ncbi:ABC transporter substrate-binding protein [Deinococcus sp. QL22]|uniref:ABC transporter substrate-binding protein n=1 Tax=Deinococcus sp. QL22 TaxID=2939437 RepID=UPI0020175900|nr:ABC transporter substrate-binding protein [Deinococcus sp. QL22]UQN08215.1 ABC transporter substrate-binding protein [Deinococcus sp. QL22]